MGDGGRATFRIFRAAFHGSLGKCRAAPSQVCLPPEPREAQGFRSCGHHHISQRHPPAWPHPSKCCAWFGKPFGAQSIKLRTLADVMARRWAGTWGGCFEGRAGLVTCCLA